MKNSEGLRRSFLIYCTAGLLLTLFIGGCALILGDISRPRVETDWTGVRNSVFVIVLFNALYAVLALSASSGEGARYQGIAMMLLGVGYLLAGPLMLSNAAMLQFAEYPFLFSLIAIKAVAAIIYGFVIERSGPSHDRTG